MNKLKRIINEALKKRQLFNENEDFNRGFFACWLVIVKMLQREYKQEDMRISENLHYKIRCLEEDNRLKDARIENLRKANQRYKEVLDKSLIKV